MRAFLEPRLQNSLPGHVKDMLNDIPNVELMSIDYFKPVKDIFI